MTRVLFKATAKHQKDWWHCPHYRPAVPVFQNGILSVLCIYKLQRRQMNKTIFYVNGPFDVPMLKKTSSKMVAEDQGEFWKSCSAVKKNSGCYVFALRAGRGITPLYVGKTKKTFEKECFTDHKLKHYNYALASYKKGTPIMFFVSYPTKKGKNNASDIADLEDFLIQVGRAVSPNLRNIKGAKEPTWGIKGVIRGGKGHPNKKEKTFGKVFGL